MPGFVPTLLASLVAFGCGPDEVCPRGSVLDGDRCVLLPQEDVVFPSLVDAQGAGFDDVASGTEVGADAGTENGSETDGGTFDDDIAAEPPDTDDGAGDGSTLPDSEEPDGGQPGDISAPFDFLPAGLDIDDGDSSAGPPGDSVGETGIPAGDAG